MVFRTLAAVGIAAGAALLTATPAVAAPPVRTVQLEVFDYLEECDSGEYPTSFTATFTSLVFPDGIRHNDQARVRQTWFDPETGEVLLVWHTSAVTMVPNDTDRSGALQYLEVAPRSAHYTGVAAPPGATAVITFVTRYTVDPVSAQITFVDVVPETGHIVGPFSACELLDAYSAGA